MAKPKSNSFMAGLTLINQSIPLPAEKPKKNQSTRPHPSSESSPSVTSQGPAPKSGEEDLLPVCCSVPFGSS